VVSTEQASSTVHDIREAAAMLRSQRRRSLFLAAIVLACASSLAAAELKFRVQEISNRLTIGYAVRIVDMNEDGKPDVVVVDTERVVWFQNPGWTMHTLIEGQTKRDNVSIAPADIDGDGKVDFALAADWRPSDTRTSGTIQWLARGKFPEEKWTVYPIGVEATTHRIRLPIWTAMAARSWWSCRCLAVARVDPILPRRRCGSWHTRFRPIPRKIPGCRQ
jgi:hypothetical protein